MGRGLLAGKHPVFVMEHGAVLLGADQQPNPAWADDGWVVEGEKREYDLRTNETVRAVRLRRLRMRGCSWRRMSAENRALALRLAQDASGFVRRGRLRLPTGVLDSAVQP